MYLLKKEDMGKIVPLFEGWNETIIWSCLQGYMGKAWVDNIQKPVSAQIITGDFCFFAGVPDMELIKNIPPYFTAPCILMVPCDSQWGTLIEQTYGESCERFTRYAFKKEPDVFDTQRLQSFIGELSDDYSIWKIDEELYTKIISEKWSRDLCSQLQFSSFAEYDRLGLGFVIKHGNEIVCGASSYTVYDKGIEIEIDTREDYRRKGLATVCGSKLILECLSRGIYPSWDSANKESAALAVKLGYTFDKEYVTYAVTRLR